jgi:chromosome segregation ATPase
MADDIANLMLEMLRAVRATQDAHSSRFDRLDLRLAAIEAHMAGFQFQEVHQNAEMDDLRARLSRIEKRLELVDGD